MNIPLFRGLRSSHLRLRTSSRTASIPAARTAGWSTARQVRKVLEMTGLDSLCTIHAQDQITG